MILSCPYDRSSGTRSHQLTRAANLVGQGVERRHIVVPFDQRGRRTHPRQCATVQVPHDITDGAAMVVDQKPRSFAVAIFGEAGKMKFADMLHGKRADVSRGVESMIDR